MGILDFKGRAAARAWENDLADLNDRTRIVMTDVENCIREIDNESDGEFVEQLIVTVADMAEHTVGLINALDTLKGVLDNIMSEIAKIIGETVQEVVAERSASTDY